MKDRKQRQLSIRVDPTEKDKLKEIAHDQNISLTQLIQNLIKNFLKSEERKTKSIFRKMKII